MNLETIEVKPFRVNKLLENPEKNHLHRKKKSMVLKQYIEKGMRVSAQLKVGALGRKRFSSSLC